jgi:hypothetical protein
MKVLLTLDEALNYVNNWRRFCEITGFSEWSVNEGGGHIEVSLTESEALELGLLRVGNSADEQRDVAKSKEGTP